MNCGKEHDGLYSNIKFCSKHCARQFAGKQTKQHGKGTNRPRVKYVCNVCNNVFLGETSYRKHKSKCTVKNIAKDGGWDCTICGSNFRTRILLQEHRKTHIVDGKTQVHTRINFKCCFCGMEFFNKCIEFETQHRNHCKMNPNAVSYKGHSHTEEEKKHLSECAKRNNFGGWHTSKSIDTRNDYLINNVNPRFGITDVEKIHLVEQQNQVKIYILDKNNLSWSSLSL